MEIPIIFKRFGKWDVTKILGINELQYNDWIIALKGWNLHVRYYE